MIESPVIGNKGDTSGVKSYAVAWCHFLFDKSSVRPGPTTGRSKPDQNVQRFGTARFACNTFTTC